MTLEERLDADLKEAMRSGDTVRKLAIRAVKTAITEAKVAGSQQRTLTDDEVLAIIVKQIKQRRDSAAEFAKGNRPDLVAKEEAEIAVLAGYLPQQLDENAIRERARAVIAELGVTDLKGIGPVMKRLTADLRGQADGQTINRVVRELLTAG
ncbi:MAG: GatB/YqeY domain-containing protein [Anaerolineae bacterium]